MCVCVCVCVCVCAPSHLRLIEAEGFHSRFHFLFSRILVHKIDINKDGFVEEAELEIWVRHKMQKWTVDEDVDAIFRDMDMDNNDKVAWDEFMLRTFGFKEEGMRKLRFRRVL